MSSEEVENRPPYFSITDDELNEMPSEEIQDLATRLNKELVEWKYLYGIFKGDGVTSGHVIAIRSIIDHLEEVIDKLRGVLDSIYDDLSIK